MKEVLVGVAALGVVVTIIAIFKKMRDGANLYIDISQFPEETVEGELHFIDIVDFFKTKPLEKGKHIPFIGFNTTILFKKGLKPTHKLQKEGYKTLLLGVYNKQQEKLEFARIIHYISMDGEGKAIEAKSSNGIVVLQ